MALTVDEMKGRKIGICVSGGLDSKTIAIRLREAGADVLCFTADLGQPDEKDIRDVQKKMAPCGVDTVIVDVREEMAEACFKTIMAEATYDGGYWNSTGIGRAVTVRKIVLEMKKHGISTLVHGATGRGNDQMRFERYTNQFAPEMTVYAPWRDAKLLEEFPGRTQMCEYLAKYDIVAFPGGKKRYSTDCNIAGLSHEAEDLESMETAMTIVEPTMGVWPMQAPDAIESVKIKFEKGRPVAINGVEMKPFDLLVEANKIGGRNGVGMSHALENRIIGTKSRGVYEAPGMELLGKALRYVYQAIMDKPSTTLFEQLSRFVGVQIYDGKYYDLSTQAAFAAIEKFADKATGEVTVGLYRGNILFESLTGVEASLYFEEDASMEASAGLNPVSSQGFAEIQSVEARSMAKAGHIKA
ncbi:MAG: argininosuccinate synthase [Kiritimatiellae bacterium]|nr:argininosuccinate synthase [Kiritimatiellia bacterium]MBO7299364.1 argininosuccinate synthase [Kiritimatiellia bacterium]MBQ2281763.1 argininosuccinate synthase [Kiritimatiellia bacterium]